FGTELHDGMAAAVGDPDVVLRIDMDAMRAIPKDALSEGAQIFPVLVELDDGLRVDSVSRPADYPQVSLRIEFQIAGKSHPDAVREGEPIVGVPRRSVGRAVVDLLQE